MTYELIIVGFYVAFPAIEKLELALNHQVRC